MSETVAYKGKIELLAVKADGKAEARAKELVSARLGKDSYEPYDSFMECLCDLLRSNYVEVNGHLFKIISKKDLSDEDIFECVPQSDGTIDYIVRYYNGACCFGEALEHSLKKINEHV